MKLKFIAVIVTAAVPFAVQAATINVQPIQVCDDGGNNCASVNTFSDYTNKIFAQSGDSVNFLPTKQFNSSRHLTIESRAERNELYTGDASTGKSDNAYDMWFVDSIAGAWGVALTGGDGIFISDDIIGANRFDTVAHELGHNLGFDHTATGTLDEERFLMARGAVREIPTTLDDIAPDGKQLDRWDPILPEITVDTIGSTPFASTSFFNVNYLAGAAVDLALEQINVNLAPAGAFTDPTNTPPGNSGSPFGLSSLNGISASDITTSGISDGSSMFSLLFAEDSFTPGDSFSFGVDIDLFSGIDNFGATPAELEPTQITFSFSNGFSRTQSLDERIATTTYNPLANYDFFSGVEGDPDVITAGVAPVPVPGGFLLLLTGAGGFVIARRREKHVL